MQNTSHAVMAQRVEAADSPHDFPTPPWASRALVDHVIGVGNVSGKTCLEPACGRGHMARPLGEFFRKVDAHDAYSYGFAPVRDFLTDACEVRSHDWVITNPPFRLAEEFVHRALIVAREGVAILARTVFLESIGRYERFFEKRPPMKFAQFAERVPMVKGRLDQKASTATGYAWFVWSAAVDAGSPELTWIPPCLKRLERAADYSTELLPPGATSFEDRAAIAEYVGGLPRPHAELLAALEAAPLGPEHDRASIVAAVAIHLDRLATASLVRTGSSSSKAALLRPQPDNERSMHRAVSSTTNRVTNREASVAVEADKPEPLANAKSLRRGSPPFRPPQAVMLTRPVSGATFLGIGLLIVGDPL